MQSIELNLMKYIHKVCVENNLVYYLYGGTLLGAVRHKGFIPWDDDLDIIVPRKDYERLISILNEEDEYRLLSYEYVEDYYYPFAKLVDPSTRLVEYGLKECSEMGVWVDIFPLDITFNRHYLGTLHLKFVRSLIGLNRYLAAKPDNIESQLDTTAKRLHYKLARLFRSHGIIKMANGIAAVFRNRNSEMVVDAIWSTLPEPLFSNKWFGDPILLSFEGNMFYAPSDYNAYLTKAYGNYMELPPENKRYSEHFYSCWKRTTENESNKYKQIM